MKKDIEIPLGKGVFVAAVLEENNDFQTRDWNAYIINSNSFPLEMVLIVTRGYDKKESTSTMRHTIKLLPAKSFAKIEFLEDQVLRLNNEFLITYFEENKMIEKKFVFKKNSIKESALSEIPLIPKMGLLALDNQDNKTV